MGDDLLRYSNKIESSDLRQCPCDHSLTSKAYLGGITVRNIYESFTHKITTKTSRHRYGTKLRHCHPIDTADPRALYYNDFVRYFGVVRRILLQAASAVRVFAGGVCCARVKNRKTAARIVGP